MKKLTALLLAMSMALSLVSCSLTTNTPGGTSAVTPASGPSGNAGGDSSVTEAANAVHFDLSTTASPGSSLAIVTEKFAEEVRTRSNGEMIVDIYYSSALGSEAQNLEALTAGTLDMAVIAVEFYSNNIPELGAMILPFLYEDYDQVSKVMNGPAGEYASGRLRDAVGVENLGYYIMMFRNMYMNKAINNVNDMAGVRIRVPESSLYVNTMKMMGAAPTPMAFGEIYTSCETGVIDGFENTPDSCLNNSMFEVLDYLNLTRHLNAPTTFSMSAKVYDSLTAEQQQILKEAGTAASAFGLEDTKANEADFISQLSDLMTVVETDTASMKETIDYTSYPFMESAEAKQLLELVQASING